MLCRDLQADVAFVILENGVEARTIAIKNNGKTTKLKYLVLCLWASNPASSAIFINCGNIQKDNVSGGELV